MEIIITAQEALDRGLWDDLCKIKGINPYAITEGIMDRTTPISLNTEEAVKLRLIILRQAIHNNGKHQDY